MGRGEPGLERRGTRVEAWGRRHGHQSPRLPLTWSRSLLHSETILSPMTQGKKAADGTLGHRRTRVCIHNCGEPHRC